MKIQVDPKVCVVVEEQEDQLLKRRFYVTIMIDFDSPGSLNLKEISKVFSKAKGFKLFDSKCEP